MFSILNILPHISPIRILDLGAMHFAGENSSYEKLLTKVPCEIIGFDALTEECEKLTKIYEGKIPAKFLPYIIGDGSKKTFHLCSLKSCSSYFEPNLELCNKFSEFGHYMQIINTNEVKTQQLDHIKEIKDVDWVKMDIQGAEADAIQGGKKTLKKSIIIETEVEFIEQYKNQPLFSDVDQNLRKLGFMFHTFLGYGTRALKPIVFKNNLRKGFKQWLWADAVYIPKIELFHKLKAEKLLKLACILHEVYNSYDFAHYSLICYDKINKSHLATQYNELIEPYLT